MSLPYHQRTHRCGELRRDHAGQTVLLAGWVHSYRDHGGLVFIDLRDHTGIVQCKFNPDTDPIAHGTARRLRDEDVICVRGTVGLRGENINPKLPTGEIEVNGHQVELLSKADTPPLPITDHAEASEELRLRYRFLDLRRPAMQRIFRLRHRVNKLIRDFLDAEGFVEIETPFLTKSTPEGARDYLVPSRLYPGSFYALPQSPQIFKQLFMIAGFDRYAQIVRCFRDEDLRADRQPEFTQLDLEMAFVTMDDVIDVVERLVIHVFREAIGVDLPAPIPRMSYDEAIARWGIDRPDTRYGMELIDISDLTARTDFGVFRTALEAGGVVRAMVVPGGAESLTRKITDSLADEVRGIGGGGLPVAKVTAGESGPELATGIAKFLQPLRDDLLNRTGARPGDALLFMPGSPAEAGKYLHYVRTRLIDLLGLEPSRPWEALWIVDFPMFEYDPREKRWFSTHHPFTAPRPEHMDLLERGEYAQVRSQGYDIVVNGIELGGGSIRIHRRDVQEKVFRALGISPEEARERFSFLLEALRFGAPPHGGLAMGMDRLIMVLAGADSLREVIAFPKTQRAICPLTSAPAPVREEQLAELGLQLTPQVQAARRAGQSADPPAP